VTARDDIAEMQLQSQLGYVQFILDRLEERDAVIARIRAVCDKPHVVPLDGVENALVIWPHELQAALNGAP